MIPCIPENLMWEGVYSGRSPPTVLSARTFVLSSVIAQFPLKVLASKSTRVESVTTNPNSLVSRSRYSKNKSCFRLT